MKKKFSGQCPCGYVFGAFDSEKDAIVKVRLHFDLFHEDFLPFGITDAEALGLLKNGTLSKKTSFFKQFWSPQAKSKNCSPNKLVHVKTGIAN